MDLNAFLCCPSDKTCTSIPGVFSLDKLCRSIYYTHPVSRFQYYAQKYGYQKGQCPGAEAIADESVALPVGPNLDESAMAAIIQGMQEALKKIS